VNRVLELTNVRKIFSKGTVNEKVALDCVNFSMKESDFVTVIGGNGAGKSTVLNTVAGLFFVDSGSIVIDSEDVTRLPEYKRSKYIGRVFQDPRMGTATNMSIEENLAMALRRGKKRGLKSGITHDEKDKFRTFLEQLGLGLENRMSEKAGLLSGGQRQAVTLIMATMTKPKILLLDEHTAALDPKTAMNVLEITSKIIAEDRLTALMVTHNMRDAIKYGNRLMMMHDGNVLLDIKEEKKKTLEVSDLLMMFEKASGQNMSNDRALLC
jgi:putative ABC transport system ATP-binding protein